MHLIDTRGRPQDDRIAMVESIPSRRTNLALIERHMVTGLASVMRKGRGTRECQQLKTIDVEWE